MVWRNTVGVAMHEIDAGYKKYECYHKLTRFNDIVAFKADVSSHGTTGNNWSKWLE